MRVLLSGSFRRAADAFYYFSKARFAGRFGCGNAQDPHPAKVG